MAGAAVRVPAGLLQPAQSTRRPLARQGAEALESGSPPRHRVTPGSSRRRLRRSSRTDAGTQHAPCAVPVARLVEQRRCELVSKQPGDRPDAGPRTATEAVSLRRKRAEHLDSSRRERAARTCRRRPRRGSSWAVATSVLTWFGRSASSSLRIVIHAPRARSNDRFRGPVPATSQRRCGSSG